LEKANVVLVVLNRNALERAILNLNVANANLIAVVVEGGNGRVVSVGNRPIPLISFSLLQRLLDVGKNFLWLISGFVNNVGDIWKFKKFLMKSGVPEDNIVNFELQITAEYFANLRYVKEHGADFFATGISYTECGLDLRYIPHRFGRGVNLASSNSDLRQGYLTAKHVFAHVKPGTIKFVLIGLTPYSFRYTNTEAFSVCPRNLQYMLALDLPPETRHDKLLDALVSDAVKKSFKSIIAAQADLNFNKKKTTLNAELPAKVLIDWEAELDNVTKKLRPKVIEQNFQILRDYIKLCRDNGAQPVGVVFPFAPIIRNNYDKDVLTLFRLAIRQFDFPGIDMFDFKLGDECFYNLAHLNLRGAALASTFLGLNLHARNLLPKETFCNMNYEYFNLLSNLLPKDGYNALMSNVFRVSAQMIRRKDKIKVGFVTDDASMWCGDELYNYFARDEKFEPTVFLCLRTDKLDDKILIKDLRNGVEQFKSHGINVVGLTDVNASVPAQDVLIFLRPYLSVLPNAFRLSRLTARTLMTYITYSLMISRNYEGNQPLMYLAWKPFFTSEIELKDSGKSCKVGTPRGLYSGYPRMDVFFDKKHDFHFDWKMTSPDAKKIIWAPHWSIDGGVKYATFQWNFLLMYLFARAHPEISWVVKPHPGLLFSAVETGVFPSTAAFEAYLKAWNDLPNAQVYTGAYYQNIFATSDGMIHDSGSFIAEYQYVDKPMIYLTREGSKFNKLGEKILSTSYRVDGRNLKGIAFLMQKVFIEGNDPLKDARRKVFDQYLNYYERNGMTASEFIYKSIASELK